MTVQKGAPRTHNGNGHVENGVVREDIRRPEVVRSLPPFHKLPTKTAPFSYLALLSQEKERVMVGKQKGEAAGRIDREILDVLNGHTLSGLSKALLTGEERTQVKIDKALCALSELVEELAATRGTLAWLAGRGKEPYTPAYPPQLEAGDLVGLRERIVSELSE